MSLKTYFKNGLQIDAVPLALVPVAVAGATSAEQTFTVAGLLVSDFVFVDGNTGNATGIVGARVSAPNTLAIKFTNPTAGSLTPAATTYRLITFATL